MTEVTSNFLREKFQDFFARHGHKRIRGGSLIPENDPSVLFTTAGMHPLVPYLQGQPHPQGTRLTNVQRCLRTTDIDEVGDETHATVFEMLGNWSLGDYGKDEAIKLSWEFLTSSKWLGIDANKLAVSVFAGDQNAPRDEVSAEIWRAVGLPDERIVFLDSKENWWPAGGKENGPQGPDTEMFYWTGPERAPDLFDPQDKRWVEIWNDVFMESNRIGGGQLVPLDQMNVDTGMGLERTVMALNHHQSIYEIDTYRPLIKWLISSNQIGGKESTGKKLRIIADHIKAATFIMTDETKVAPGKSEQGYVLRRLLRRAVVTAKALGMKDYTALFQEGMEIVVKQYEWSYEQMRGNLVSAQEMAKIEIMRFESSLDRGMKKFGEIEQKSSTMISGDDALLLLQSYGFPIETTVELAKEKGKEVDLDGFAKKFTEHQEKSRAGSNQKFKGGLVDQSIEAMRLHTTTHLLQAALRQVFGQNIIQRGSNITAERLRFDFNCDHKLTPQEIKRVEKIVNRAIQDGLKVERSEMTPDDAEQLGALGLFKEKYEEVVSVYKIGNVSLEICGGPHVENTSQLGKFRIIKEEAAGAGLRRIKAVLD